VTDRLAEDAVLLVSELVTNAAMHAGTEIAVACRLESPPARVPPGGGYPLTVVVEVTDHRPAAQVLRHKDPGEDAWRDEHGRGLQIVDAMAETWGVTYAHDSKTVWFRLTGLADEAPLIAPETPLLGPERIRAGERVPASRPTGADADWGSGAAASFLAEAGELLAGQLDEDMVAALTGQLLVPRLADWCGVWLAGETGTMRLSHVWTKEERRLDALRRALEKQHAPPARLAPAGIPWPWPWPRTPQRDRGDPRDAGAGDAPGTATAFSLVAGGRCVGALIVGRAGPLPLPERATRLLEDVARRVAQAVATARRYTQQVAISRALQRRQLPVSLAAIPGIDSAIVYEPHGEGQTVGGDFYDLFPIGGQRWCFLLGDVMGSDPEAMFFTGLARHLVRMLARENPGAGNVLGKLNAAVAEEGEEAAAYGGEVIEPHFVSMLYGELDLDPGTGGAHCTVASAGHPLPLRLSADGSVAPVAQPQMLLGISKDAEFHADSFYLAPGDTLLCVTDGVTERRSGDRQLDDNDGLAEVLRGCRGLGATAVAERVRRAAHDFDPEPVDDDLAVLVLEAVPALEGARSTTPAA
jgi:serine phosphatase RsbU (regulator of sigma subunit)